MVIEVDVYDKSARGKDKSIPRVSAFIDFSITRVIPITNLLKN
jgi:hypothetical protein